MPLYPAQQAQQATLIVSPTANTLSVSIAATATSISGANTNRKGMTIFNSTSSTIFFDYSNSVTTTAYAFRLAPGDYYEMPTPIPYQGAIFAIVASGTASPLIKEFV
jgi:hypothetical protein